MKNDDETLRSFDEMLNHELPPPINEGDVLREEVSPKKATPRWLEIVRGLCFLPVLVILAIRDWFRGDLDRSGEPVKSAPKLPLCPDFDEDCKDVKDCHLCSCYGERGFSIDEPWEKPQVHCIELDRRRDQYHLEPDQFRNQ